MAILPLPEQHLFYLRDQDGDTAMVMWSESSGRFFVNTSPGGVILTQPELSQLVAWVVGRISSDQRQPYTGRAY